MVDSRDKVSQVKTMCIFIHNGKFLACPGYDENKNEHFLRLIGGSLWKKEKSIDGIRREVLEELGSEIENIRFLGVSENIFEYQGVPGDEVVFIYQADLINKDLYDQEEIKILDHNSVATWTDIEEIKNGNIVVYPDFDYLKFL